MGASEGVAARAEVSAVVALECLLAQARLWRWLAQAFWYPEGGFLAKLSDPSVRAELEAASMASSNPPAVAAALARLWEAVTALATSELGLAEEHTYLFARQVQASPHATCYVPGSAGDRAAAIAELGSLYAAFGLRVAGARPGVPDHVSAECEFVAVLLAKEAYAMAQGWVDQACVTRLAREKFVTEHLALWLPAFAERLTRHHRLAFYPALAAVALALLEAELPGAGSVTGEDDVPPGDEP